MKPRSLEHRRRAARWGMAAAVCALALVRLDALTLDDLLNDSRMTPKRFANYFDSFDFEGHSEVQAPEVFLSTKRGDCDDYAILADYVLKRKKFGTRLVHVRLVGKFAHAICYVTEAKAYLDYNNRIYYNNLEGCGSSIREMAEKAAASFKANWTSASEFTYDYQEDRKHFGSTVVKTDAPDRDPDLASHSPAAAK